ncbi:MAG: hypothetical protein K8S87_09780, partial [Planctomycetes bacterium]|nr:hypothetical protein [Planctomycetota bacterium]
MKFLYSLFLIAIIILSAVPASAQDGSYNINTQNPVLSDNSQTIFLTGRLQLGWASSVYNGSD